MRNRPAGPIRRAVVLLSGGLDSATTLYYALEQGFEARCLIFDYGQRHRREIEAARAVAQSAGVPVTLLKISLPWKGSSLLDAKVKIPKVTRLPGHQVTRIIPSTYVPGRNIVFLSFALSYAEAIGAQAVFIGANAVDYSGYPDCRPAFYRAFKRIIACGTKAGLEKKTIRVVTPLIRKSKAQIIRLGMRLGVPYHLTRSCYRGGRRPCGQCDSCYYRAKGFMQAGMADPACAALRRRR